MTKDFRNKIKEYVNNDIDLFYNSSGNKDAYKLCVRHISGAPMLNKGLKIADEIHPYDTILLVDFKKETIVETEDKIKIIPLKTYS